METILEKTARQNQIEYWTASAQHDLSVAETLFKDEKYDWCLFL
jgi:HEPN domain-containing protein